MRRGWGKFWFCLTTAIADSVRLWGGGLRRVRSVCVSLSAFFIPGCGSAKLTEIGIKSCQRYRQRSLLPRISGAIVYSVEDITRGGTVSEGSQANRVLPVGVSGCVPVDSASWRDPAAQNITGRPSESNRRPGDVTQGSRDCLVRAPLKRLTFKLSLLMSKMK